MSEFDPLEFEMNQLAIVVSNVEFAMEPENGSLDCDDLESISQLLRELYQRRYNCELR